MKRNLLLTLIGLIMSASAFGALSRPDLFSPVNGSLYVGVSEQLRVREVTGATAYEFMISTSGIFTTSTTYTSDTTLVIVDSLEIGQKYYWRARAMNATDTSSWSSARNFTVVTKTRLSYPGNNSTNTIGGKAGLRLNRYGMKEFIIELDTSSSMNSGYLRRFYFGDTIKFYSITHVVDSLYFGKDYYWRAVGWIGDDTLEWSDTYKFTTLSEPVLKTPNNKQTIETDYTFTFTRDVYMDYYEYEFDSTPNFNSPMLQRDTIQPPSPGAFTVTEMDFDQKYYWRVRGFSTLDTTDWATRECIVDGAKGKYFNDYTPAHNPTISFRIERAKGSSHVQLEFDTSLNFNSPLHKSLLMPYDPSFSDHYVRDTIKNLHYGKEYRMRVRMIASHDTSEWEVLARRLNIRYGTTTYYPFTFANVPVDTLLVWDANMLIGDEFRIQLDTSPNFTSILLDTTRPGTINSDWIGVNLKFNTDYWWRAMSWHEEDTSNWVSIRQFTTYGKPVLSRPFNSTLLRQGPTTEFKWEKMSGVDTFQLQLDTSTNFNSSMLIDTVFKATSSSDFELSQLIFGTHYKWRLRAIKNGDTSSWSDNWEFIVWEKPRLNSPNNNANNTVVYPSFDFNSINGTTGYQIQIDTASDLSNTPIFTKNVNNPFFHYQEEDLLYVKQYYWRVRVFHETDTSEWSDQWTFTTRERDAPNLITPSDNSTDVPLGVDLDWDQYPSANNYLVQLSLNPDMSDSTEYKVFTSKKAVSLRPDTTYYWRVMAREVNDFAISDFTEIWKFRTVDSFAKVVLTLPANNATGQPSSFTFRWEGVVGATGYDFQLSVNPDMSSADNRSTTSNQFAYSGLSTNNTYYWHVRAKNAYTRGPWSEVFKFNTNTSSVEVVKELPIKVYPNPTNGVFTISLQNATQGQVIIYNSLNQKVVELETSGKAEHQINLSNQPAGIYYAVYLLDGNMYTVKILKE